MVLNRLSVWQFVKPYNELFSIVFIKLIKTNLYLDNIIICIKLLIKKKSFLKIFDAN